MLLSLKDFGFSTWLDKILEILNKCELSEIFNSNSFTASEIHIITHKVKAKLKEEFTLKWHTEINKLPKLRTYRLFKTSFETERYLFIFNKNHRQALSRLRASAHTLEIEKGRWRRKLVNGKWKNCKVPIEERLCIFCPDNSVESEIHVIISCSKYSDIRSDLFKTAKNYIVDFESLDNVNKFIAIMQTDETSLIHNLAKCTYLIFKCRTEHLNDVDSNVDSSTLE